jgi:Protein of unknown function (DUF1579)
MNDSLIGFWTGTKLLNLSWLPNPEHFSEATLQATRVAGENFWEIAYTWSHEDAAQSGILLLGIDPESRAATAAWCDSWHQSACLLFCQGEAENSGRVSVLGSYKAPPDPDWGWRITLDQPNDDALELVMTNIAPDGDETLAVRATFQRAALNPSA